MRHLLSCLLLLSLPAAVPARSGAVAFSGVPVRPGELVVKANAAGRTVFERAASSRTVPGGSISFGDVASVSRLFPAAAPSDALAVPRPGAVDLTLLFAVRLREGADWRKTAARLLASGTVDYAEPFYLQEVSYIPNDPQTASQYYLPLIQAYAGWNVWQGDSTTVIGIVDTGTDWDHPDLQAGIAYNYGDPVNGTDDDGDGYTDNFRGWDISENDNDPVVGVQVHGSHVSGCAAAVTDNATGVAGAGFRCRFLPVKTSFDNSITSIDHGYEGIVYAADHGCSVINCSWGRRGGPSQFEQDIIDYATVNRGALVVASAGNQGKEADFYPASYRHVLSVAATNQYDNKSGFSNYSYFVDLCAPGDSINSTVYNDTYGALSGTSMSAPLVSGCAAILRSFRPALTADQAGMQLRATCDDIYSTGGNAAFYRRLGKGRVNLFRALTDSLTPGVEVTSRKITDAAHANFLPGDTLYLTALFTNLLHPTSALTVTLSTAAAYVSLLDSTFAAGVLGTLDTVSNYAVPYRIVLSPATPANAVTDFTLTLRDGGYTDFYSFRINLNTDYLNITVNDVATTVNSRGRFGYNQVDQTEGLGFTYLSDQSLLYEGGLMVGYSQAAVSNCVRNTGAGADNDFVLTDRIRVVPAVVADFDAAGRFGDGAAAVPVPVTVTQAVYAWNNDPYRKFIVLRYALKNSGISPRSNLYAGLFADWDIADYTHNRCAEDAARKMGYAWSADTGLFGGVKVLSQTPFGHYAVDNDSSGLGGLNLTDGFSTAEKYLSMTTSRAQAGVFGQGKDVIDIVSTGPFTLAPGDSVIVAFAVLAGDSLASLQASADAAQVLYDSLLTAVREIPSGSAWGIVAVFPNPARGDATLEVETDTYGPVRYAVTDLSGRTVATRDEAPRPPGRHRVTLGVSSLSTGLYLVRMQSGTRNMTVRLSVIRE